MVRAVYPGNFDPVTLGHLDIIQRAARVVDELIIGIAANSSKTSFFTLEEREELLKIVTENFSNVTVKVFEGITVEFARENNAHLIIRGLRAVTDFESEMQIAQTNHTIDSELDTMFFTTSLNYAFLSSTIVKEVAFYGADISKFVPPAVMRAFQQKVELRERISAL